MKIIILLSLLVNQLALAQGQKGLTWGVLPSALAENLVNVNCHGLPATEGMPSSPSCNAYVGDTYCSERRPVLCINKSISLPEPQGLNNDHYNKWSGGEVRLTEDVEGHALNSLQAANSYCSEYFGKEWRMAEHHDGWGWGLWAMGTISNKSRFWVHINDQKANCWDSPDSGSGSGGGNEIQDQELPLELKPIEPIKKGLLQFM